MEIIHLQHNVIKRLDGAFAKMKRLRELRLDGNKIMFLQPYDFQGCSCLTYLDVSFNGLKSLEVRASLIIKNLKVFKKPPKP